MQATGKPRRPTFRLCTMHLHIFAGAGLIDFISTLDTIIVFKWKWSHEWKEEGKRKKKIRRKKKKTENNNNEENRTMNHLNE